MIPDRSLARQGYLRGADLSYLACASYLSRNPRELYLLTLDQRQRKIAAQLGFPVPDLRWSTLAARGPFLPKMVIYLPEVALIPDCSID